MEAREYSEELDLQKYWLVLKRRWLPATSTFSLVVALSLVAAFSQKPKYEATASLLIRPDKGSSIVGLEVNSGSEEDLRALSQQSSPVQTQAQIVDSPVIAKQTIAALHLTDDSGQLLNVDDFSAALQVKNIPATDILQVSYTGRTAEEAAAVVNKVVELYVKNNITANRAEAAAAGDFISNQLPGVEIKVQQAEAALRQFKDQNKVVSLDDEAKSAVTVIATLDEQISQTQGLLASTAAQADRLRGQLGMNSQQAIISASLSQSTGVQDVLKQYQEAQSQLKVALTRYREGHPVVTALERQVEALRALQGQRVGAISKGQGVSEAQLQIGTTQEKLIENLSNAEVQQQGFSNQLNQLIAAKSAYRERANVIPRLQQQEAELERKLNAAKSTYETLLSRLQEVRVAENQNVGNARVVSKAMPPDMPASARKLVYLAAGAVAGALLGTAAAFGLELIDQSVKTLKESREFFKYPLLGVIPAYGRTKRGAAKQPDSAEFPIFVRDLPQSPICDSYQMLQTNLKFLTSDQPLQSIVVTSSVLQEGKSTVAANLAAAMAQIGRRVLLVDADLRQPSQHHAWGLTNFSGLSNVIVGQAQFATSVHTVMPNLDVLTAGVMPPNPIALLDSKRMASLIETFSTTYDFVIFDAPALAGTADAAVLGKLTDGVLLVTRPGVVNYTSATAAKEYLAQSGQNVLGLVVNGVVVKSEPDSYFYHTRDNRGKVGQSVSQPEMMAISTSKRTDIGNDWR